MVAPAFVKVDLDRRPVQHAEGGTVREVLVRDGQRVEQGEPLLVLGDVVGRCRREPARLPRGGRARQPGAARSRADVGARARLSGRRGRGRQRPIRAWPSRWPRRSALFDARRDALVGQVALLRAQQREGARRRREALRAQIAQASESLRHQKAELETNRNLLKDGFISATRISQLEATVADYGVKLEERRSELARAEQRLVDTDLRIKSLEGEYRQQASDQLKVTAARLAEIQQEQRKTSDAATRQVIVAPAAGDVINLKFTSPGAVVSPRETDRRHRAAPIRGWWSKRTSAPRT